MAIITLIMTRLMTALLAICLGAVCAAAFTGSVSATTFQPAYDPAYHPVGTFQAVLPSNCRVVETLQLEEHSSRLMVREVVVYKMRCGKRAWNVMRHGPWLPTYSETQTPSHSETAPPSEEDGA